MTLFVNFLTLLVTNICAPTSISGESILKKIITSAIKKIRDLYLKTEF